MITGDHFDPDPCSITDLHRFNGLLPRGIDQSKQTQNNQAILHISKFKLHLLMICRFKSKRQYTLPFLSQLFNTLQPVIHVQRLVTINTSLVRAHSHYALRRPFEKNKGITRMIMVKRCHKTVFRFKRDKVGTGIPFGLHFHIQPCLYAGYQQCTFHRVTMNKPFTIFLLQ